MEFAHGKTGKNSTPKMPAKRQVLGLRVSSDSNQGGRDHMEDMVSIRYERRKDHDCAFLGVFDGHGGKEAAVFARDLLWDNIKAHRGFESKDPQKVKQAISEGFLKTQEAMWKKRGNWGTTKSGYPSTSGTTACVAIIRGRQMWVAHVGDSRAVLGVMHQKGLKSRTVTVDHKPESPKEIKRIEAIGGKVQAKNGVQRVVWERTKLSHSGPIRRSTSVDHIPFLAVARSLGDLWSYSTLHDDYVISPKPDITHHVLNPNVHNCLVIGSDGLWNMLSSSDAIYILSKYNVEKRQGVKMRETMAQRLVKNSINRWVLRSLRADNTTAITIVFEYPKEKPKTETEKTGDNEKSGTTAEMEEKSSSPSTSKEEVSCTSEDVKEGSSTTPEDAKASTSSESKKDEEPVGTKMENKSSSPSTSNEEVSCTSEDVKEGSSTTPEDAKASTSSESKKDEEPVGTKLRIRGETDFVGVQGFGSFRPKLRHSNMYRDYVFRFHYPEPEENPRWWDGHPEKRKASEYEDSDPDEWQPKRWKPDGQTYINTPVVEVTNTKIPKRKFHSSSPWMDMEEYDYRPRSSMLTPRKQTPKRESPKKCDCFECHNNMAAYCTKKKPSTPNKSKIEIIREYKMKPDYKEEEECTCFECTHGVPHFCSAHREGKCNPISNDEGDESPKNCICIECKNGRSQWCTGKPRKPRLPKKKVGSSYKQSRYNTRNSPTEPEVPLAQRALRSLNKSTTQSTKPKKLYTPQHPAKQRLNGRYKSLIKSC